LREGIFRKFLRAKVESIFELIPACRQAGYLWIVLKHSYDNMSHNDDYTTL